MESNSVIFGIMLAYLAVAFFSVQSTEAGIIKTKDDFGFDKNFGNWVVGGPDNKVTTNNKGMCPVRCQSSEDCCDGQRCKINFLGSRYGYCAKNCLPVGPGGDCRSCQACSDGFICTVHISLFNQQYRCIPRA